MEIVLAIIVAIPIVYLLGKLKWWIEDKYL